MNAAAARSQSCQALRALVFALSAALLLVALPAQEAHAQSNAEVVERLEWLVNSARTGRGLPPLQVHLETREHARVWSERMAWRGYIYHDPGLGNKVPASAQIWAETVGRTDMADPAYVIRNAWFQSPGHRAVLLDQRLTHFGVGIARKGGQTYATARFWG